ncbi:ATP-dependent Clp protease adaptor protein ClpS [Elizabethkingia sp. YR214]|uniref:ATP-dependent Clp protease adaptor ClpS n=1 Tax=Elizabethkingia sp. YR214 TaxID=2135667 RepID=UPI000D314866|nr:ATP-dependent Clp protease adaptor ClpS [Elizabethkingia sp. YR214]PUB33877.1 ATP-dependent Clp protease adaptor protein ClpS [Elizabethkingia sp. YR214]
MKWEKLNSQSYDSPKREYEEEVLVLDQTDDVYKLVLHNDDVNTFDFVIECLIEICKHTPEQAEQCTLLVHYKGKCTVKTGAMDLLKPMHQKLLSRGLTSEIV